MQNNFLEYEKKWQKIWEQEQTFQTKESATKPKYFILDMFPYPTALGLHVGHVEGYVATDILARYKRAKGFSVLQTMGFDAFGLPTEQFAIQNNVQPEEITKISINNFKAQLNRLGKAIDWQKSISTHDPEFYHWTQWIFKKLYEHDLAELKDIEVNFCPELGTVLANDEITVKNGLMVSERGNFPVYKKTLKQWVLKITKYADRLIKDLDLVDWPEEIKDAQRNWIGKSEGTLIDFEVLDSSEKITCFTTRIDTIYGLSYLVLAPEHPLALKIATKEEKRAVENYIKLASQKSDLDRETQHEKTGVFTGAYAKCPISGRIIPVWVADYVFFKYATGAVMAVPAHDERDFEFANKFGLDILKIIDVPENQLPYTKDGVHINSPLIDGQNIEQAKKTLNQHLKKIKAGSTTVNYRLRDWVFSRQRYWGEPFPLYFDAQKNVHLVADKDLPLVLPKLKEIKPSGTGDGPLANCPEWVRFEKDGQIYSFDTNTMPQVAGSSWYYIAYILKTAAGVVPLNSKEAKKLLDSWLPVDFYVGGKEHTTGHLLYARFWHKFLYDLGLVSQPEPFQKLFNQGMILMNGQKMSKSRGNVVNPDEIFETHGADALRLYVMFMGPLQMDKDWSTTMLDGAKRFLDRVWRMHEFITHEHNQGLDFVLNQTILKVEQGYETISFNTAISQMMIFVNEVYKQQAISVEQFRTFMKLLNPICPHITEEMNQVFLNSAEQLVNADFPQADLSKLENSTFELIFQVNGKIRGKEVVEKTISETEAKQKTLACDGVQKALSGLNVLKVIYIKERLVNIVAK